MAQSFMIDVGTKVFHYVVLLLNLVVVFGLMFYSLGAKKEYMPFFMTNTFLTTYDSDRSLVAYTPYAKPRVPGQIRETYLNCLQEAQVAVNDVYNCKADDKTVYRACLATISNNETQLNKLVKSIQLAIGSYGSNVTSIVQLPTRLTSLSNAADMKSFLSVESQRALLKRDVAYQNSPVAAEILSALVKFDSATGPLACASALHATLMSPQAVHVDVGSALLAAWDCTADYLITDPIQKVAYEKCIPFEVWPTYDVMQTQYSLTLFGSYNRHFFLVLAGWLMASFAVYTMPGVNSGTTANGKPAQAAARAGKVFTVFAFVWNFVALIIVVVRSFTPGDSWSDFPMSVQTVLLSLFFSVAACIYFGREIYELFIRSGQSEVRAEASVAPQPTATADIVYRGQASRYSSGKQYHSLQGFMRVPGFSAEPLNEAQYLPLVAPAWNDAWFFVDAMLFLGVIGMSKDVVTADIAIVTMCILFATIMNSSLIRLLYEGYVNEVPSGSSLFENFKVRNGSRSDVYANKTQLFSIRVMAMVSSITSFLLALISLILVATRYGSETPTMYIAFAFFVPQVIWLLFNLALDFNMVSDPFSFYYTVSVYFSVCVLIRTAFLFVVFSTMYDEYKKTVDNSDSLNNLIEYIYTDK